MTTITTHLKMELLQFPLIHVEGGHSNLHLVTKGKSEKFIVFEIIIKHDPVMSHKLINI